MKHLLLWTFGFASFAFGQVSDSVSLQSGYTNESYYSFANGEVSNVDNYDWDLAFETSSFGSAVRLNRKRAKLWVSPAQVSDWSTTLDTNGMAAGWDQLVNGYEFWSQGALNMAAQGSQTDLGWGEYNTVTHVVEGSRIFVLELSNGNYKKLMIEELASGTYQFVFADLDNANEVNASLAKSTYATKNFGYYNLETEMEVDREPAASDWDLVFTNYVLELGPGYYAGVTSALHNAGDSTSEVSGVPVATSMYNTFDQEINTIGYDWKTFNMSTYTYDIVTDLSYFVSTSSGDVWKIVFTGFGGSSDGKIYFTKEQVEFAGVPTYAGANLDIHPNPAGNSVKINYANTIKSIQLVNMNGQVVYSSNENGFGNASIDVSQLQNGVYFLNVTGTAGDVAVKKLVVQH